MIKMQINLTIYQKHEVKDLIQISLDRIFIRINYISQFFNYKILVKLDKNLEFHLIYIFLDFVRFIFCFYYIYIYICVHKC